MGDDYEQARDNRRAVQSQLDDVIDKLAALEKARHGYETAASAQHFNKAIKQAHKWAREARSAL